MNKVMKGFGTFLEVFFCCIFLITSNLCNIIKKYYKKVTVGTIFFAILFGILVCIWNFPEKVFTQPGLKYQAIESNEEYLKNIQEFYMGKE